MKRQLKKAPPQVPVFQFDFFQELQKMRLWIIRWKDRMAWVVDMILLSLVEKPQSDHVAPVLIFEFPMQNRQQ